MATKLKTNKAMRLGSILLVVALLTTCAISGTFAKYTTEATASDNARVASWGIGTTNLNINDLFKSAYDSSVKSTVDVIAPGTSNEVTFYIGSPTSAPEVDYTFKVNTDDSECADAIKNNSDITWTFDGTKGLSWDDLLDKIEGLGSGDTVIKAGNFPNKAKTGAHTVGWEWKFEDTANLDTQDETDTAMGNKTNLDQVTLNINFEATQVD